MQETSSYTVYSFLLTQRGKQEYSLAIQPQIENAPHISVDDCALHWILKSLKV